MPIELSGKTLPVEFVDGYLDVLRRLYGAGILSSILAEGTKGLMPNLDLKEAWIEMEVIRCYIDEGGA